MRKVYFVTKRRWKYFMLSDELFQILYNRNIITYTNCVYAMKLYNEDYSPIIISFPKNRELNKYDFTIQTKNDEILPLFS